MSNSQESRYQAMLRRKANMSEEDKEKIRSNNRNATRKRMKDPVKRAHYNLIRNRWRNEMREIWKERELCSQCGCEREIKTFKTCSECREQIREYYKKRKESL